MPPLNALGGLNGIMSEVLLRVGIQVKLFIKSRGNGAGGGGGGAAAGAGWAEGIYGNSLNFLLNFPANLKLL